MAYKFEERESLAGKRQEFSAIEKWPVPKFCWKTGLATINQLSCPMMVMGRDHMHSKLIWKQHKSQVLMCYMAFPSKTECEDA